MSTEVKYTSDQIILCLIKKGYELVKKPRRGRYYLEHKNKTRFKPKIVPMGRTDLTSEYVKILLKDSPINFSDFKKMVSSTS